MGRRAVVGIPTRGTKTRGEEAPPPDLVTSGAIRNPHLQLPENRMGKLYARGLPEGWTPVLKHEARGGAREKEQQKAPRVARKGREQWP